MFNYLITLPTDTTTNIGTATTGIISDLSPIWTLVIGILLGVAVIGFLFSFFKGR